MPGFDKNLDKKLFSQSINFAKSRITVGVFSYNDGMSKLQLSRENKDLGGEFTFAKLGRMTKEEVDAILPLIEKAKKFL